MGLPGIVGRAPDCTTDDVMMDLGLIWNGGMVTRDTTELVIGIVVVACFKALGRTVGWTVVTPRSAERALITCGGSMAVSRTSIVFMRALNNTPRTVVPRELVGEVLRGVLG